MLIIGLVNVTKFVVFHAHLTNLIDKTMNYFLDHPENISIL